LFAIAVYVNFHLANYDYIQSSDVSEILELLAMLVALCLVVLLILAGFILRAIGLLGVLKPAPKIPGASAMRVRALVPVLALIDVHSFVMVLVLRAEALPITILGWVGESDQSGGSGNDDSESDAHS
jgi:hypothetical protein